MKKKWSEVESYDEAQLKSIIANAALYNSDLVEECKHELEVRTKSAPLLKTVLAFDDKRLNEVLSNPRMYSEELVHCCRSVQRSRRPNKLPSWFWWAIGGAAALVAVAVVIIIILLSSPSRKRAANLEWGSPERMEQTYSSNVDYGDEDNGDYIPYGLYPQASMRLLTASDLYGLSKWELKVMRNEILARYGYIFKTEALREYFSRQDWYVGRYTEVNSMITSLEWENIKLIKQFENR